MFDDALRGELTEIVGARNITFAKEDKLCYSFDATNSEFMPDGVVFPATAGEISAVMKLANRDGFPVTARGAGSGFTGGSLAVRGGLVLSTERMNKIIEINTRDHVAVVEPGVINSDLQAEAEARGLFYPPDPSSLKFCTIGGNIAECAGGPRAVKYGVTRDYVLGLEVVLPTGEVVATGVRTMKGVVGYDLTRLMVGSEGTLGIVTRAFLRLIPLPETTRTMLAVFPTLTGAASAVDRIMNSGVVPSVLEIIDSASIEAVREYSPTVLPEAAALLLIEVDGGEEQSALDTTLIEKVCAESGASEVRSAADKVESRELWEARRSISPSLKKIKPDKLNEDIVVPRSKIPELIEGISDIAARREVVIASFGHAGDGNIHVNIMIDRSEPGESERGEQAVSDVFALTLALGGTISGEHGVGTAKAPYISMELKPEIIGLMRGIKELLDPRGVLNPGKIFAPAGSGEEGRDGLL